MSNSKAPTVKCPICGRPVRYDASSPFRPFCSERCRDADLGVWASEGYRVPEDREHSDRGMPAGDEED